MTYVKSGRSSSKNVSAGWLNTVRAERVLRWGTPLAVAQLLAGDHQAAQGGVKALPLSGFLRLLANTDPAKKIEERLTLALQKSGWERPVSLVCVCYAQSRT